MPPKWETRFYARRGAGEDDEAALLREIAGTTCCAARNAPNVLTRQVFSGVLGLVSISRPNGRIAAL